jgi:glycine oxidase
MSNEKLVDHIIVGLGLSGAAMALQLIRRGKKVVVFDLPSDNRASMVAAGLFNPVSGKMMTKSWRADDLFPYLADFYTEAEQLTSQRFFHPGPVYIPFRSVEEQNDWTGRSVDESIMPYIGQIYTSSAFGGQVIDNLGGILLKQCGHLNVVAYLHAVRGFIQKEAVIREQMNYETLRVERDFIYCDDVRADSVIFCDGLHAKTNPLTRWMPVHPLKGETIDVRFSRELSMIYNRGVYAVPSGNGVYKVGATFERSSTPGTSATGREQLEERLKALTKVPYAVVAQNWGVRPTTRDRRPIIGQHPQHSKVFVFNGMGTKGVSQAPYFSMVLADAITRGTQIPQDVNISRFNALSSESRD